MRNLKILVLAETLWPCGSGGELATILYVRMLSTTGAKIRVLIRGGCYKACVLDSVKVYVLNFPFKYSLLTSESRRLLNKLVEWADLIYVCGLFDLIPFVARVKKPKIIHLHAYTPVCPYGHMYNFVTSSICQPNIRQCTLCSARYIKALYGTSLVKVLSMNSTIHYSTILSKYLQDFDALMFVSEYQEQLYLHHLKHIINTRPKFKSAIIYNPVPYVENEPLKDRDFGYFGGADILKGFHVLLCAWLKSYTKHPDVNLHITKVEKIPFIIRNGEPLMKMRNIRVYPKLPPELLGELWKNIGVVVIPSIWPEPAPYVAVEACLRGRVVVASNIGGLPEILSHTKGVFYVPPNDVEKLSDVIETVANLDLKDILELGSKNRESIRLKFNNDLSLNRLLRVIDYVL